MQSRGKVGIRTLGSGSVAGMGIGSNDGFIFEVLRNSSVTMSVRHKTWQKAIGCSDRNRPSAGRRPSALPILCNSRDLYRICGVSTVPASTISVFRVLGILVFTSGLPCEVMEQDVLGWSTLKDTQKVR